MNGKLWHCLLTNLKEKNKYITKVNKLFNLDNENFELDLSYFQYYLFDRKRNFFTKKFTDLFGAPRKKNENFK